MMANTRSMLLDAQSHMRESMGKRRNDSFVRLSPVPDPKDVGRQPSQGFGQVNIDSVVPDPDQPRSEFSEGAIDRLAASIRDKGQLSPIRVRWSGDLGKWIIISGERRWRAVKQAGLETVVCYFHEEDLTRVELLEQQLIENLLREDLTPLEEARGFAKLMELNGWDGKQVAEALRVSRSKVSRALALLRLPDDIQQEIEQGKIAPRSAYELSRLTDQGKQRRLAEKAAAGQLTHSQAAQAAPKRPKKRAARPAGVKLTFFAENDFETIVKSEQQGTYHDVKLALEQALEEVQLRIDNNVPLL